MKHSFPSILILLATIVIASCNNEPKNNSKVTTTADTSRPVENKVMIPSSTCYSSATGKDSFLLKVEVFPNVVTGKLSYKYAEKDNSNGELDGLLYGDTLVVDYKFMSEGKLSTRQVIFLIKDNTATEGYGAMEEKEGKMVFKNIKDVTFGKGLILKKVECGEY